MYQAGLEYIIQIIEQAVFPFQYEFLAQAVAYRLYATDGYIEQGSYLLGGKVHLQIRAHHAFVIGKVGMPGMQTFHEVVVYQVELVFYTLQDFIALDIGVYFVVNEQ